MQKLTVTDILSDIEFELAQGLVLQGDLGQSVQALRNYQNEIRTEVLGNSRRAPNLRYALARLFQINDMLITVCQELATTLASVRQSERRTELLPPAPSMLAAAGHAHIPQQDRSEFADDNILSSQMLPWSFPEDVKSVMGVDALQVDLEVRVPKIPLIGGLLRRFRLATHNLVLFYVQQLASKQQTVNQVYGEWIGQLLQLSQEQSMQIDELYTYLESLTALPGEKE